MMKPEENLEVKGFIKIRDGDGKRTKVPFRYQIVVGDNSQLEQLNVYDLTLNGNVQPIKVG